MTESHRFHLNFVIFASSVSCCDSKDSPHHPQW